MSKRVHLIWLGALSICTLFALAPAGASAEGKEPRCWPALTGCPAETYEQKAAQAARHKAADKYDLRIPTAEWRVSCTPTSSPRKYDCGFLSIDEPPADCVGGAVMVRRDGRWNATKVEVSCRT